MTKKEILERKKSIKLNLFIGEKEEAFKDFIQLIMDLNSDKQHAEICSIYNANNLGLGKELPIFEIAYSLDIGSKPDQAEIIYQDFLEIYPQNTAALNNLSVIKRTKGKYNEALALISNAYELDPTDETVKHNYDLTNGFIQEFKEIEEKFRKALEYLSKENSFVIQKLKSFLTNIKKEKEFKNNKLPVPNWKFKVLMGTNETNAYSLKNQWLEKGYILNTGERDPYNVVIYQCNNLLEKAIDEITFKYINPAWIKGIESIEVDKLEALGYYTRLKQIKKINQKYQEVIKRDFDELFINHLMGNVKSVIILSGSLLELLMTYFLEKKKIKKLEYLSQHNKQVSKKLYEATLIDFVSYLEQNKLLSTHHYPLANISRLYRNYIHPGKEVKEQEPLTPNKSDLCFISVMELFDALV